MRRLKQFLKRNATVIVYGTTAAIAYLLYRTAEATPDYIENAGMPLNHLQNIEHTNTLEKTVISLGAITLIKKLITSAIKLYNKGLNLLKRLLEQNNPKGTALLKREKAEKEQFIKVLIPQEKEMSLTTSSQTLLQRVNQRVTSAGLKHPCLLKLAEILSFFSARRILWPEETLTESATGAVITSTSHSSMVETTLSLIFSYHKTTAFLDYRQKVLEAETRIYTEKLRKINTLNTPSREQSKVLRRSPRCL